MNMIEDHVAKALDGMTSLGEFLLYAKKIRTEVRLRIKIHTMKNPRTHLKFELN